MWEPDQKHVDGGPWQKVHYETDLLSQVDKIKWAWSTLWKSGARVLHYWGKKSQLTTTISARFSFEVGQVEQPNFRERSEIQKM